jgi:hypothetical protein
LGIGPPLADAHCVGFGLVVRQAPFAIALVAQIVQVGHRDCCQPLVFRLAVLRVFALENAPRRGSAESLVQLIDGGQQLDIGCV